MIGFTSVSATAKAALHRQARTTGPRFTRPEDELVPGLDEASVDGGDTLGHDDGVVAFTRSGVISTDRLVDQSTEQTIDDLLAAGLLGGDLLLHRIAVRVVARVAVQGAKVQIGLFEFGPVEHGCGFLSKVHEMPKGFV